MKKKQIESTLLSRDVILDHSMHEEANLFVENDYGRKNKSTEGVRNYVCKLQLTVPVCEIAV